MRDFPTGVNTTNGRDNNSDCISKFLVTSEVKYERIAPGSIKLYRSCEKTYKVPVTTSGMSLNLVDWLACIYGLGRQLNQSL